MQQWPLEWELTLNKGLDYTIHYGAPRSLDDYIRKSGRAGREGQQSVSKIYWKPSVAPLHKSSSDFHKNEVAIVRSNLEESVNCRRHFLLHYFDPVVANNLEHCDNDLCCDDCQSKSNATVPL